MKKRARNNMGKKFTFKDVDRTRCPAPHWFLWEPIIKRFTLFFANYTSLTANHLTVISLLFSLAGAWFFLQNQIIIGAILYQIRYILDCSDGWVGRLKGTISKRGGYLDNVSGKISLAAVAFGLFYGQYLVTKNITWMILCPIFIFLYILRSWEEIKIKDIINEPDKKQKKKGKASLMDTNALIFFIIPIISVFAGYLMEAMIIITALLVIKTMYWFIINYKKLSKIDRLKRRKS